MNTCLKQIDNLPVYIIEIKGYQAYIYNRLVGFIDDNKKRIFTFFK